MINCRYGADERPDGRCLMKRVLAVGAVACLFACNEGWATIYEWVDSQGVVNMTDNP